MEEYFQEDFVSPYGKKYKLKIAIFCVFLIILFLLVYFAFFHENFKDVITGKIIVGDLNESKIKFDAELTTTPILELDGEFKSVRIKGESDSFFYVGDQKFSLANLSSNHIILSDYGGKIYFNENNIFMLKGKAEGVIINGVSLTPKLGKNTKVYFDDVFDYTLLEIRETASIKKLSYNTSGKISLFNGKNLFDIYNEEIIINNFQGDLKAENGKFRLNGYLEKLEVMGESDISVGG